MTRICFSCDIFGGFLLELGSLENIVLFAVSELRHVLKNNNFDQLISILNTKHFHIHDYEYPEICYQPIIYICSHCNV
jgi:hypothetical protein